MNDEMSRKAGSGSARKKIEKSIELGGRTLTLTTGELAEQAAGAVVARMGDTVVLATVTSAPLKMEMDFFRFLLNIRKTLCRRKN